MDNRERHTVTKNATVNYIHELQSQKKENKIIICDCGEAYFSGFLMATEDYDNICITANGEVAAMYGMSHNDTPQESIIAVCKCGLPIVCWVGNEVHYCEEVYVI
jgi:hypothetical protein